MHRIKQLRKEADLTQSDLAMIAQVGQNTISNWETGRTEPDLASLQKMASYFGVTIDYILGRVSTTVNRAPIKIPVLGSVPAGIPLEAIEDIVDWEEISPTSGDKEYFALRVQGDSMWPEYLPGDTVIVRRTPVCESGDVCVVYVNGYDATLKQVKHGEDGSLTLVPKNQSYPPRTYTAKEIESLPVSICGVVVELRRSIK